MENDSALCMLVVDGEICASGDPASPIAWRQRSVLGMEEHEAHWVRLPPFGGRDRYAAVRIGQPRLAQAAPFRAPRQSGFLGLHQLKGATRLEQQCAARALHMSAWLHRSAHCPSCGHASAFVTDLNKRVCQNQACGFEAYPRIEPAVIALLTDGARCLLGRQPNFPKGFYAPLAGFVEAGETPEQAVAREVFEETGQTVTGARYVASQPWPYPGSLMLGYIGDIAAPAAMVLADELEDANWFSRAAVQQALEQPGTGALFLPPRSVIGGILIQHWLASPL